MCACPRKFHSSNRYLQESEASLCRPTVRLPITSKQSLFFLQIDLGVLRGIILRCYWTNETRWHQHCRHVANYRYRYRLLCGWQAASFRFHAVSLLCFGFPTFSVCFVRLTLKRNLNLEINNMNTIRSEEIGTLQCIIVRIHLLNILLKVKMLGRLKHKYIEPNGMWRNGKLTVLDTAHIIPTKLCHKPNPCCVVTELAIRTILNRRQ